MDLFRKNKEGARRRLGIYSYHSFLPSLTLLYLLQEFCTQAGISKFTQYFPYILLLFAFILAGIERFFDKMFSTNQQIAEFHSLLAQAAKSTLVTAVRTIVART